MNFGNQNNPMKPATNTMSFGNMGQQGAKSGVGSTQKSTFSFGGGAFGAPKVKAVLKSDSLFARVWKIRSAYDPDSVSYQFCYIFYNKQGKDQKPSSGAWANLKPKNITDDDWIKICAETPDSDNLVPCPVLGFDALNARYKKQKETVEQLQKKMKDIQDQLRQMTSFYPTEIQGLFERIQQNSITIEQAMLNVIETREVQQHQNKDLTEGEKDLYAKLEKMKQDLKRPGMFENEIEKLAEKVKRSAPKTGTHLKIDKESLSQLVKVLKSNTDALEALEKTTKDEARKVEVLEEMRQRK